MTKKDQVTPNTISIDANTQVKFGIKSFIALILSILGIFFGFYQIVVAPKLDQTNNNYNQIRTEVYNLNTTMYNGFTTINDKIDNANLKINIIQSLQNYNNNATIKRDEILIKGEKKFKQTTNNNLDTILMPYYTKNIKTDHFPSILGH